MPAASYNRVAGESVERLAALSDGIFAVAMTLLVLDLRAPAKEAIHGDRDLWIALGAMAPQAIAYLMSFLTLGIFWLGQQAQLSRFARSSQRLSWTHIAFLFAVTLMPFSTRLLAEFIQLRAALLCYWANILLLGSVLYASWRCARASNLLKEGTTAEVGKAIERRILIGQALYALGALLCVVNTYWSIVFIVLVQLNYAVAPRLGFKKAG
ncbi:MAG TPA: TMEM175 family protein [Bryobacteraceae bacterium]|nr:TMEM175 family protein [Bryobacteraceae bacterium]